MLQISDEKRTGILAALMQKKSYAQIKRELNVGTDTITKVKNGILKTSSIDVSDPFVRSDALAFIQKRKKNGFHTDELAKALHTTANNAKEVIQYLSHHAGYNILFQGANRWQLVVDLPACEPLELSRLIGTEYKFGLVSDTHLNNTHERLDVLEAAYDEFARLKISDVFHAGNIIDGEFRFNRYEIKHWGVHDQSQYVADVYPQRQGITTRFITGTCHEGWYQDSAGLKVGWYIEKVCNDAGRHDLIHIGHVERDVVLKQKMGNTIIRIMHPGGGSAYALSYPGQKMVESFQGGEKPHILVMGHYHKWDVNYAREITTILAGCTQDQTGFMRKNKLAAHVGFSVITVGSRVDGTIGRFNVTWYPFYDREYHKKLNNYIIK